MELALNLVWFVIAALMLLLWTCHAVRNGENNRTQIIALIVLILVIFPVISVTDDLMIAQNLAEAACSQRKDYGRANAHPELFPLPAIYSAIFVEYSSSVIQIASVGRLSTPEIRALVIHSIDNRPPPSRVNFLKPLCVD
jgi:hypothetical protein